MTDRPDLAALLRDVADWPEAELPALVTQLAAVMATAGARLVGNNGNGGADRMLSIEETAARTGMSRSWLYRHHGVLPFARKIGRKVVFSEQGLARWLARTR